MREMLLLLQTPAPTAPVIVQVPPAPTPPVDPNFLITQIIPIVEGVLLGVALLLAFRWLLRSPVAEAIAEGIRMRRRRRYGLPGDATEEPRVATLEEQVRLLTAQVGELGERLDFTERMLATQAQRRVGAGS